MAWVEPADQSAGTVATAAYANTLKAALLLLKTSIADDGSIEAGATDGLKLADSWRLVDDGTGDLLFQYWTGAAWSTVAKLEATDGHLRVAGEMENNASL